MRGDGSFHVPGPRWLYAASLGFLGFLLLLELFGPSSRTPDPNAPDALVVARLRKLWPQDSFIAQDEEWQPFLAACNANPAEAARAIYALFRERYAKGPTGIDAWSAPHLDESQECVAWTMGELADGRLREELVRALANREAHPQFRRALAVALCRNRHRDALPALLDRALDRQESNRFRRDILLRLHRVGGEPPERLRELLAQPFANLDFVAAGTLGRWGDPAGAVLIRDGLRFVFEDEWLARHLAMAANRLAGTNHPFSSTFRIRPGRNRRAELERHRAKRVAPHLKALETLGLPPTPPARPASFEELLAAGEDFDIAAASMLVADYKPEWIAVELQRLDRLAESLRAELDGLDEPEAKIAVLNRVLFVRDVAVSSTARRSLRVSYLPAVFREDYGNCLGYSTLYVALGARLGLPLRAVAAPGHCFVRYDDGHVRRNIETTNLGVARDDESYFRKEDRALAAEAIRRGVFLRDLTNRRLIALVLNNYAYTRLWYGNYAGARVAAEQSLQLEPDNHGALYHLALALHHSDLDARERVVDALQESNRIWPCDARARRVTGQILLEYGNLPLARLYFENARDKGIGTSADAGIARTYAREGRIGDALALLQLSLARSDDPNIRVAQLECRIRRSPDEVDRHMERAREGLDAPLLLGVTAAQTLLDLDRPQQALTQLDRIRSVVDKRRTERLREFRFGGTFDRARAAGPKRGYLLARARAYHALGQQAEALAALEAATKLAPPNRDVLVVARLLGR